MVLFQWKTGVDSVTLGILRTTESTADGEIMLNVVSVMEQCRHNARVKSRNTTHKFSISHPSFFPLVKQTFIKIDNFWVKFCWKIFDNAMTKSTES